MDVVVGTGPELVVVGTGVVDVVTGSGVAVVARGVLETDTVVVFFEKQVILSLVNKSAGHGKHCPLPITSL